MMKNLFNKIRLDQLYTLCNIISDNNIRDTNYIEKKYSEKCIHFDETLLFLNELKVIRRNSNEIRLSHRFIRIDLKKEFKELLLSTLLLTKNNLINNYLNDFLINFQIGKAIACFNVTQLDNIKYSDLRNLLQELDFLLIEGNHLVYNINPKYNHLFINYLNKKKITPSLFKKNQAKNEFIGYMAEKTIIDYEIERLSKIQIKKIEIEHISQNNVLAGYDIKSFENYLDKEQNKINRYIEVKAVSIKDYKFYWSRNEINISKILGSSYYLYLLPVSTNGIFNIKKLIVIKNPFKEVYLNIEGWNREEENISFSKIDL